MSNAFYFDRLPAGGRGPCRFGQFNDPQAAFGGHLHLIAAENRVDKILVGRRRAGQVIYFVHLVAVLRLVKDLSLADIDHGLGPPRW